MYKSRFKAWGLTKHLKIQQVDQICTEALSGIPLQPPSIRGRTIGSQKLKRYLTQVNTPGLMPPRAFHWGPSPSSSRLRSPDSLRFSEDCMHAVAGVARHCIKTDTFIGVEYNWLGDAGIRFWFNLNFAIDKIAEKNNMPEAFRMIHKCYDDFNIVLQRRDPTILWMSLLSVLVLATVGYDLAASFVRYAANLCAIKLGRHALLTSIFTKMQAMGVSQLRQAAFPILSAYFDALKSDNPVGEEFRRISYIHAVRSLNRRGALSMASASSSYKKCLKEFAACQDTQYNIDWYCWALQAYSLLLSDNGKFAEALDGLDEVGNHLHRKGEFNNDTATSRNAPAMQFYHHKGVALQGLGRMDEATPYFVRSYELTRMLAKDDMFRITKSASDLEAHYRRKNDIEAAEKICADFEEHWGRLLETKVTWHSEAAA